MFDLLTTQTPRVLYRAAVPGLVAGMAMLFAACRAEQPEQQAGMAPPSAEAVALHAMSAPEAAELTRAYRQANAPGTVIAGYFDRAVVDQLLSESGVAGLRIYQGMNPDGSPALVIVGVDGQGNDLEDGTIAEKGRPCPPFCSKSGSLSN